MQTKLSYGYEKLGGNWSSGMILNFSVNICYIVKLNLLPVVEKMDPVTDSISSIKPTDSEHWILNNKKAIFSDHTLSEFKVKFELTSKLWQINVWMRFHPSFHAVKLDIDRSPQENSYIIKI